MNIRDKTILITGGSSGIGLEIVKKIAKNNRVIVVARQQDKLEKLREEYGIKFYQADLSDVHSLPSLSQQIKQDFETIDLLIHNAAVQYVPEFLSDDFDYDMIEREITINFTSLCCLTSLLLPLLQQGVGSIIMNINSGLAISPKKSSAIYCATKGAMDIFSQSLSYQLEGTNVKVLQSFLPVVETPMTQGRSAQKMSALKAATKILYGIENEIITHDIGKVKMLRFLNRFFPFIAQKIMKAA